MKQLLASRLPALWLSLVLLTIYLLTYAGVTHSIDEIAAVTVTESLVVEQQWHTNQMAWDQARTPPQNAPGIDGKLYSKKGLGVSLLTLPFLALPQFWPSVGAVQSTLLLNSFLLALLGYLFYQLALTLGFSATTAALGTVALGLATPLWPYARTLFSEPLAALGLGLALLGAVRYRVASASHSAGWALWWCSCGLVLLVLARTANALLILPFLLYLGYMCLRKVQEHVASGLPLRELLTFGLPLGGAGLLLVVYNYVRFHTWLTFPQADFETFSTPLLTGITGLLVSPGKGLLWYMPLVLLIFWGYHDWRKSQRGPEYALAATLILITLLFYAKWYDWTGGRAWGPRLLVMTAPAFVVLGLPALDRLQQGRGLTRWIIGGVLLLSGLVQLPGVFLNFELLEAAQMQAGSTFEQLVWSLPQAPILTYWSQFLDRRWFDPAWGQATFWQQSWVASGAFIGVGLLLLFTLGRGLQQTRQAKATEWLWGSGVMLTLLLALLTIHMAANDSRWAERTANPADNQAVIDWLRAEQLPGDVVVLDMTADTDQQGRQRFWLNTGSKTLPYIAWVRNSPALDREQQLAGWLQPYSRIWLVMQETDEGAPDSTSEQWLDQRAYRGRQQWIGSQRLVEYLTAVNQTPIAANTTPISFGDAAVLSSYQIQAGRTASYMLLDLTWQTKPAAQWRFSLQALDSNGQVMAQLDDAPARQSGQRDRRGLTLPRATRQVILKLYDSQSGQVAFVKNAGATSEFLPLVTLK